MIAFEIELIFPNKVISYITFIGKLLPIKIILIISAFEKKCGNYETFFNYYIIFPSNISFTFV
jgi:hypothetical protein